MTSVHKPVKIVSVVAFLPLAFSIYDNLTAHGYWLDGPIFNLVITFEDLSNYFAIISVIITNRMEKIKL